MSQSTEPSQLFDVAGRHVLVTGGSSGIGEMIVRGFHAAGAHVYITSRTDTACRDIANDLGDRAIALPGDVATVAGITDLVASLRDHTARLDVPVNNAGATWGADLEEYPDAAWDKVLALNLKSPFHLTVACLDLMRAAATQERPARVIMIGSVDGIRVPVWESYAYSASKAGVHQLTKVLGRRLASEHITVNAIAPGVVPSRMTRFAVEEDADSLLKSIPLGRFGQAGDMAGAAIYLASPAGSWVSGLVISVDGGMSTLR